jgi:hypothetical protein
MGWALGLATWLGLSCAVAPIVGRALRAAEPRPVPARPDVGARLGFDARYAHARWVLLGSFR